MYGILDEFKFGKLPHFDKECYKGYVTSLRRNEAGILLLGVACAQAQKHAQVTYLTRTCEKEVALRSRTGKFHGAVNIQFEREDPAEPLVTEIIVWNGIRPPVRALEEVACGLWQVVNSQFSIAATQMQIRALNGDHTEELFTAAKGLTRRGMIETIPLEALTERKRIVS